MTIIATAGEGKPAFNREIELAPDKASVSQTRDFVRAGLCARGLPDGQIEDGALIVSELVTTVTP
jgi:hypothetical protein